MGKYGNVKQAVNSYPSFLQSEEMAVDYTDHGELKEIC